MFSHSLKRPFRLGPPRNVTFPHRDLPAKRGRPLLGPVFWPLPSPDFSNRWHCAGVRPDGLGFSRDGILDGLKDAEPFMPRSIKPPARDRPENGIAESASDSILVRFVVWLEFGGAYILSENNNPAQASPPVFPRRGKSTKAWGPAAPVFRSCLKATKDQSEQVSCAALALSQQSVPPIRRDQRLISAKKPPFSLGVSFFFFLYLFPPFLFCRVFFSRVPLPFRDRPASEPCLNFSEHFRSVGAQILKVV